MQQSLALKTMFDVVIETKDDDLNEKGVSWHTRNALVD
jgi:hypothetical protein